MLGGSCSQVEPAVSKEGHEAPGRTTPLCAGSAHSRLLPVSLSLARSMRVFSLDFFPTALSASPPLQPRSRCRPQHAAPLAGLPAPSVLGPDWPAVPRCLAMHFWLSHLIKLFEPHAPMGESGGNASPGCFNWLLACVRTCIADSAESS